MKGITGITLDSVQARQGRSGVAQRARIGWIIPGLTDQMANDEIRMTK
jgi:hypothetical protein